MESYQFKKNHNFVEKELHEDGFRLRLTSQSSDLASRERITSRKGTKMQKIDLQGITEIWNFRALRHSATSKTWKIETEIYYNSNLQNLNIKYSKQNQNETENSNLQNLNMK